MAARASAFSSPLPSPSFSPSLAEFEKDGFWEHDQHAHDGHQEADADADIKPPPEDEDSTYILEFSLGIPHFPQQQQRQAVHLYFEPTWIPQPLVSICFRGPPDKAFVCPPTQESQDNDAQHQDHDYTASYVAPSIYTFPSVDLDDQLSPSISIESVSKPPNPRCVWYCVVASFAVGILASMAWSTLASSVTSSRAWVSLTEPDSTLEFNGTLIAVAEGVLNATLLLEQPLPSLPAPDSTAHFCAVIFSFTSNTIALCAWKDNLPDRPDLDQLCADFSQAHSLMFDACHPRSRYRDARQAIGTVLWDITWGLQRQINLRKEDFGDDDDSNDVDRAAQSALTTRATRLLRRSRDAAAADFILRTLQRWRQGDFAALQARMAEQEHALSILIDKTEYISQGFEYELKRRLGGFKGRPDTVLPKLAAINEHLPSVKEVLARLEASKQMLERAFSRLVGLEAGLAKIVNAHEGDQSRASILLTMGWIPAAPVLEDLFYACVKLEDAADAIGRGLRDGRNG
ncbi:hypothetical protein QBC39DRAFT_358142 [Podospora conica]|nr:hypothetical protein QBC39DRAFT_358142 [Schizothecium conicum]